MSFTWCVTVSMSYWQPFVKIKPSCLTFDSQLMWYIFCDHCSDDDDYDDDDSADDDNEVY